MMDNLIFGESKLKYIEAKHFGEIQFLVLLLPFPIRHSASATQCQVTRSYFSIMSVDTIIILIFIIIVIITIMISYLLLLCSNLLNQ